MSPLWTHSLLTRHAGSAPPRPIRTVPKEKLILKLFRNEVVPVSRLHRRSSALRSRGNDRKTKCVPKCRNTHHSGQIPFSSGRNTLWGSIRGETVKQSPAEAARQAGRLLSGGGGGTTTKKNPRNFCEELEGYPDSCNSNKLDYSSQMTSFPALFQPCS